MSANMDLWSTKLTGTSRDDRGEIRRAADPNRHPELGLDGCRTMYEVLRRGKELNPLGPCMGYRATSTNGFATPFIYTSYTECVARVNAFAAGLESLKLVKPNPDDGMKILALYMKNCMEFVLAEQGAYCLGGTSVALYDTFGHAAVQFIIGETGARSVVCPRVQLGNLCKAKKTGQCPAFEVVILVDGVTPDAAEMAADAKLELISFAKVEAVGAQVIATQGHKHNPPSGKDVATLCYTSGTTGNPKGAMITHENLMSTISGIPDSMQAHTYDRHLSYMPLAHIFERVVLSQMLSKGASIAFWRGDPLLLLEDLQACRPTVLAAAPRVLNKIYDKICAGLDAAGGAKKRIFDAGMAAKTAGLRKHGHLKHTLYDALLFNKIKKALGMDQLRFLVSGSAPLGDAVMTFFRCMLGVPVFEGYGQTEGAAAATIAAFDDMTTIGHVGGPTAVCEIVLIDVPEMGYLHTDKEHRGKPCQGRGEICVRGPNVFKGYYKDEAKTKETIDEEGWLHSGDIGLWTPEGNLQIIDRKKNLFKLSQGEYISPEKIENIISRSLLIGQCFVYGDTLESSIVAIVVPDEEPVKTWAANNGMKSMTFAEVCKTKELNKAIMADIKEQSVAGKLNGLEMVKAVYVDCEPFTVENGLLTPTFKLKRKQMRDKYETEIAKLYASLPAPKSKL